MRPSRAFRAAAAALGLALAGTRVASAAGPAVTVSGTATILRDTDASQTYGRGVAVGVALRIRGPWWAAVEAALNADHEDFTVSQGGVYAFQYQSWQAGPRLAPAAGRVRPYAEVLAGVTRLGIWERRLDRLGEWGAPQFSVQPGAGVGLGIAPRLALRIGADLRFVSRRDNRFDRRYWATLARAAAGLAVNLGE